MSKFDAAIEWLQEAHGFGDEPEDAQIVSAIKVLEAAGWVCESAGGHGKGQALSFFDALNIGSGAVRVLLEALPDGDDDE